MTLFLDTETTGLNPPGDQLVEIGLVDEAGEIIFHSLINPGVPIPPDATAVHGITNEMIRDAPSFDRISSKLRNLLLNDGKVVIFNAEFDVSFFPAQFFDQIQVNCALDRYRLSFGRRRKLERVAKAAGHVWTGAVHRAVADALACRSVWKWLDAATGASEWRYDNLDDDELARQAWSAHLKSKQSELELLRYKVELGKRAAGDKWVIEIPDVCRITVSKASEATDRVSYRVDRDALMALDATQRRLLFDLGVIRMTERGGSNTATRITFTDKRGKAGD